MTPQRVLMRSRISSTLEVSPPEVWMDLSTGSPSPPPNPDPRRERAHHPAWRDEGDVKQFDLVLGFDREVREALARRVAPVSERRP